MHKRTMVRFLRVVLVVCAVFAIAPVVVHALPPAPGNDSPLSPQVISPAVPVVIYGTSVLADDSITNSGGDPDMVAVETRMDGPDVFYSFTPNVTATYRFQLAPWQRAPLRSSDRQFTLYIQDSLDDFLAGVRAPGSARPVNLDISLTAGETYRLGIDHDDVTHDNFPFTLIVDELNLSNPDDCTTTETLPTTLPVLRLNDIDGAANDFAFAQDADRCAVSGSSPTTAPGIDHVYSFKPTADGDYAIEVISSGFDAVLYVDDSCTPFFPDGCMGASNHSTSGTSGGRHELVVVTLEANKEYWIFVDNGSTTANSGPYALIIDDAFNYEITETESNDTTAGASVVTTPLAGGQLVGPADADYWAVPGLSGDRVYAYVNNGGSSNSTLDTELRFFATDGTTLIEYDNDDGDGIDSPIEDLRFIYSTTSSVIAGAQLTADGTHYLYVTDAETADTGTIHRYRFHVGVEPGTRAPLAECEPNDTLAQADRSGKNYFSGVIPTTDDLDVFAFDATIGDRFFIAFDGDPERDSTGSDSANTDPNAFHGKLVVYDPAGDVLLSDVSDSNTAQTGGGDFPAQGAYFVARQTGNYYVQVGPQSSASQVGPTETYQLAIFKNNAAPALAEDVDPVISVTPDFPNNLLDVTATDNAAGDSGICNVELFDNTNLQLSGLAFTPGDGSVNFQITLVNPLSGGQAKLLVTDCEGNTACAIVLIDVDPPVCAGSAVSTRTPNSLHGPLHVPNNDLTGIDGTIDINESGLITDVNVTITIETIYPPDMDVFLISPSNTSVELITDRGSSLAFDITDATFDDDADEIMPSLSSAAPYTGTWLPEDGAGLAQLNGEDAQGTWRLNVSDDSTSASGGARLLRWSLDVTAGFSGPQTFQGTATDTSGIDSGIQSIVLSGATNVQLDFPNGFTPGDQVVEYTVTLIDSTLGGSGTVTVTDLSENACVENVVLNGLVDADPPSNAGSVTTNLTAGAEVQIAPVVDDPAGVLSSVILSDSVLVGEVEASITVDTENVGRITSTLTHGGEFASLVNRVGMDERFSVGLTKDIIEITLDDDAPAADDAHEEPALGTTEFQGLHQPDGRGDFILNGITSDPRDNMMFSLNGLDSAGGWDLFVADVRPGFASTNDTVFRRWSMTVKSPCGPERYVGRAMDLAPESGICSVALGGGSSNLALDVTFNLGDEIVDYVVSLVDPTQPGNGTVEIEDCFGNQTPAIAINLAAESDDAGLPVIAGVVNGGTFEWEGTATDDAAGDTGIVSVELAPYFDNLQIVSVTPDLPNGAGSVDIVIGLVNGAANGRGYVQVTDACGWRSYALVEIEASSPLCTGLVGNSKRYYSADLPAAIPENNSSGVTSNIIVADVDTVDDVDVTFNIEHPNATDIDMSLTSPVFIDLFTDRGSTGNDFLDTTLDDEASTVIPSSSTAAPFTGSWQPETGSLSALDGGPAAGTYSLKVADDANNYTGSFENWSMLVTSSTFPQQYDGRAEDNVTHDSGICTIELLPGATNLSLAVPHLTAGDPIARYSVSLIDPLAEGTGVVRVTDCAGNTCEVNILLPTPCGDLDTDMDVDFDDFLLFLAAYATNQGDAGYRADADLDNDLFIGLLDYQLWIQCYRDFIGSPFAGPPAPPVLGDVNGSHNVDLVDFVTFAGCFGGSDTNAAVPCIPSDMDRDGDVDLVDFITFSTNFGVSY